MTYCVGLCTEQGVLIAADSSFSSMSPSDDPADCEVTTVFGERQGDVGKKPWRFVFENGMKLSVGKDTAVGFAGDVRTAESLVSAYWEILELTKDVRQAVRDALTSVTPSENDADVLFAFYELGKPCLLHVSVAASTVNEVNGLIQLGSTLPSGQHSWTASLVSGYTDLLSRLGNHPLHVERIFSLLVSALQSYGVHDYLLPHGVGGAFIAAWVTAKGARWQGDHLYVIHGEQPNFEDLMCATMIRKDALCLVNNQNNGNKVIINPRSSESANDTLSRAELAGSAAYDAWDGARFDYFVSINKDSHIVTVLEMCQKQHHDLLSIHSPGMAESLGIVWTGAFLFGANRMEGLEKPNPEYLSIRFHPFVEASLQDQQEREQFAWENFGDWQTNKQ